MGTTTLEEVAAASGDAGQHMFQLYVIKDRDFTQQLVQACTTGTPFCMLPPSTTSERVAKGGSSVCCEGTSVET